MSDTSQQPNTTNTDEEVTTPPGPPLNANPWQLSDSRIVRPPKE